MNFNCSKCGGPTEILFNIRKCPVCDAIKPIAQKEKRLEEILGQIPIAYQEGGFFLIKPKQNNAPWHSYNLDFLKRINRWLQKYNDEELEKILEKQNIDVFRWHGWHLVKSSFQEILNHWIKLFKKATGRDLRI